MQKFKSSQNKFLKSNFIKHCLSKNSQIFFSSITEAREIINGTFNYHQCFASFLECTTQKQETANVIGIFTNKLKKNSVLFNDTKPIKIADLGCADAKAGMQYIDKIHANINHLHGFNYFGIDTNNLFLNEAKKTLTTNPLIKKFKLINNNALDGSLKYNQEIKAELFDFVFISHTAYYLKNSLDCRLLIADIERMLSKCGIAIFLHEDSTAYFRSTYNEDNFKKVSTHVLLEQSALIVNTKFNQFISNKFVSKLNFSPLSSVLWEAMKDPKKYPKFAKNPNFTKTLEVLAFIVHRDLHSLAEERLLADYINEIREAIAANNNSLDLKTHMQTLVEPKCALKHTIAQSLEQTFESIAKLKEAASNKQNFLLTI